MKRLLLFFVSLLIVVVVEAQSNFQIRNASTTGKGLVYNTEAAVILEGKTNGFAAGYMWGNLKTYYKTSFYKIELGYLRNPKESRISPQGLAVQTANSYIYGKRNSFWQLKGGWGAKRYLSEKDAARGVAVGLSYSFGPNLGLLKPYYLQLHSSENSTIKLVNNFIKYSPETAATFLNKNRISGTAPFFTGIGEMKLIPGGHINFGLHLDWGAYEDYVRALEVGVAADFFLQNVPIMVADSQNRPYFFNLYMQVQIGKRK
ncbi:MAG: hypothetical protein ACOYOA_10450 [Saprospiraceae bacterium]